MFSVPGGVVHLRRWAFQDVLQAPASSVIEQAPKMSTSFSCVLRDEINAGVIPSSLDANGLVEWRREVFSASYLPLTRQIQVCLGRMFEPDPEYTAHYDGIYPAWPRVSVKASTPVHAPTMSILTPQPGSRRLRCLSVVWPAQPTPSSRWL